MLQRYGSDAITVDAVVSGLAGMEAEVLGRLLQNEGNADDGGSGRHAGRSPGPLARPRGRAVPRSSRPGPRAGRSWQRTALLRGLDAGLGSRDRGDPAGARRSAPASVAVRLPAPRRSLAPDGVRAGRDRHPGQGRRRPARLAGQARGAGRGASADGGRDRRDSRPGRSSTATSASPATDPTAAGASARRPASWDRRCSSATPASRRASCWRARRATSGLMPPLAALDRRRDRVGPDLRAPGVGPHGLRRRAGRGQGNPRPDQAAHAPVDRGRAARGRDEPVRDEEIGRIHGAENDVRPAGGGGARRAAGRPPRRARGRPAAARLHPRRGEDAQPGGQRRARLPRVPGRLEQDPAGAGRQGRRRPPLPHRGRAGADGRPHHL